MAALLPYSPSPLTREVIAFQQKIVAHLMDLGHFDGKTFETVDKVNLYLMGDLKFAASYLYDEYSETHPHPWDISADMHHLQSWRHIIPFMNEQDGVEYYQLVDRKKDSHDCARSVEYREYYQRMREEEMEEKISAVRSFTAVNNLYDNWLTDNMREEDRGNSLSKLLDDVWKATHRRKGLDPDDVKAVVFRIWSWGQRDQHIKAGRKLIEEQGVDLSELLGIEFDD